MVFVIFANKQDGQLPYRGQIEGFMENAFIRGAIPEETGDNLPVPLTCAAKAAPVAIGMPPPTIPFAPRIPRDTSATWIEPPFPLQ